jgi:hypothetical protein
MGVLSDAATGPLLAEDWTPAKKREVYWTPDKKCGY